MIESILYVLYCIAYYVVIVFVAAKVINRAYRGRVGTDQPAEGAVFITGCDRFVDHFSLLEWIDYYRLSCLESSFFVYLSFVVFCC